MAKNSVFQHFNKSLTLACMLIAVSTFNYGFDNAGFNTTQAMDGFQHQFGRYNPTTGKYFLPPSWLSLFNSLNYIGFGVGVMVGSLVSGRYGRRMCMFSMSCYALITATIAITSTIREQILAARVLNCTLTSVLPEPQANIKQDVYVGMELAVVPVFQSEIVPAPVRGLAVGSYQFSLMVSIFDSWEEVVLTFGSLVLLLSTAFAVEQVPWREIQHGESQLDSSMSSQPSYSLWFGSSQRWDPRPTFQACISNTFPSHHVGC